MPASWSQRKSKLNISFCPPRTQNGGLQWLLKSATTDIINIQQTCKLPEKVRAFDLDPKLQLAYQILMVLAHMSLELGRTPLPYIYLENTNKVNRIQIHEICHTHNDKSTE